MYNNTIAIQKSFRESPHCAWHSCRSRMRTLQREVPRHGHDKHGADTSRCPQPRREAPHPDRPNGLGSPARHSQERAKEIAPRYNDITE